MRAALNQEKRAAAPPLKATAKRRPSVVLMPEIVVVERGLCGDGGEFTDA
jgi:hypothetical protein